MGRLDHVAPGMYFLPHVCESRSSRRFRRARLVFKCGYSVVATGAIENRGAQKAASWMEPPVPFGDAFATDARVRLRPGVGCTGLGRRGRRRQALLRDPGKKNSDDLITGQGEEC